MKHPLLVLSLAVAGAFASLGCQSATLEIAPLATEQVGARSLVANGAYLYWAMPDDTIRRVSIDGGKVETITTVMHRPLYLAVDDENVYFACDDGDVGIVPKTGGEAKIQKQTLIFPVGIAADEGKFYVAQQEGPLVGISKDGAFNTLVVDKNGPTSLARQGSSLIWTSGSMGPGAIRSAPDNVLTATDEVVVLDQYSPQFLTLASSRMYWTDTDPDAASTDPGMAVGRIAVASANFDGSDVRRAAANLLNPTALVADEAHAFAAVDDVMTASVTEGTTVARNSQILLISSDGSAPQEIARTTKQPSPATIAVDETSVYFIFASEGALIGQSKNAEVTVPQ